jgi:hypothetical protein
MMKMGLFPELYRLMKHLALLALLLFSLPLAAKRAPKWKEGNFKTTASGLKYKIVKPGKADSIGNTDVIEFEVFQYVKEGKKYYRDPDGHQAGNFSMDDPDIPAGIKEAVKLLQPGGKGYFIIPPSVNTALDSMYFIHFKKLIHITQNVFGPSKEKLPNDSVSKGSGNKDSMNIVINDPAKKYFGDTLFSVMKLAEQPQLASCGIAKVIIAFKFEMTYFENGLQRKSVLVFIECPDFYGEDYFTKGSSYVVTCVPLLDNFKTGSRTMNAYSLEKLDRYYGLRVQKM